MTRIRRPPAGVARCATAACCLIAAGTSGSRVASASEIPSAPAIPAVPTSSVSAVATASVAPSAESLSSDIRAEAEPSFNPALFVLRLPQAFVELAFVPLLPVTVGIERYDLLNRTFDLFINEDRTFGVFPLIEPFDQSGIGGGVAVVHNNPLGSPDRVVLIGMLRENLDRNISISYARRLPLFSGRTLSVSAGYSVDRDHRFYGLGHQDETRRLIRIDAVDLSTGLNLLDPSEPDLSGTLRLGYRRRDLLAGRGAEPSILEDDVITPPPGFGRALDYPELSLEIEYDTKDALGRTTRGIVASLFGSITKDLNGAETSGALVLGSFTAFLPVLPLNRVLMLHVGAGAGVPIGDEVLPLHQHVRLGGSNTLRGYPSDRFIDRLGWWGSLEYRYGVYDDPATGNGLSAFWFVDVGRVGARPEDLWKPPAYSLGIGLRAEASLLLAGRIQFAYSPEGFRVSLSLGEIE